MEKIFLFSDNTAPVHPAVMAAMVDGNKGHAAAYGSDQDALETKELFKKLCGRDVDIIYVPGGTGGNVFALDAMMGSHEALVCSDCCHVHTNESGAFEKLVGGKIYPVKSYNGKIDLGSAETLIKTYRGNFHHNQPAVISIAQTTEVGTVYTVAEIKAVCDLAHHYGMKVHMDGARIANALASLRVSFQEMCVDTGVDVVTFGGTKNGLMFGEANLYFDKDIYERAYYLQKQDLQVISKRRYLSLQFGAYLKDDLYLKLAEHANRLICEDLQAGLNDLNVVLSAPLQSNQAFLILPREVVTKLLAKYEFAVNRELDNYQEIRLVTSFISTKEEIQSFLEDLKKALD